MPGRGGNAGVEASHQKMQAKHLAQPLAKLMGAAWVAEAQRCKASVLQAALEIARRINLRAA